VELKIYGTKARIHTSYEVKESDICRAVAAIADLPSSTLPGSPFILALGTPAAQNVPHELAPWHREQRTLCENKAVAILEQMQAGRPALIQKDCGEMLIAIVLDRQLADAKALVDDPAAFTQEMTRILLEKQSHPLIALAKSSTHCAYIGSASTRMRGLFRQQQAVRMALQSCSLITPARSSVCCDEA